MKKDKLSQIWNSQKNPRDLMGSMEIVKMANRQRKQQFIGIAILAITIVVLTLYAVKYANAEWSGFTIGLGLMIGSLTFRVVLEVLSIYRKESRLVSLDGQTFRAYLKRYYKVRKWVNFVITPICFALYCFGFIKLLPYFKQEFSAGFYTYLLISGWVSIAVIAVIIVRSIQREHRFLEGLQKK
ncbi:hypothetical protein [Flagellimonas beolgyonensis]|uniref:hypothetical protein n=1 Tax=Flagellimonas beolgyonensis TaxID=864064 RepID=UPI003D6577EA